MTLPLLVVFRVKIFRHIINGHNFGTDDSGSAVVGGEEPAYVIVSVFLIGGFIGFVQLKIRKHFDVFAVRFGFEQAGNIFAPHIRALNFVSVFVQVGIELFLLAFLEVDDKVNRIGADRGVAYIVILCVNFELGIFGVINIGRGGADVFILVLIAAGKQRNRHKHRQNKCLYSEMDLHFSNPLSVFERKEPFII